MFASSILPAIIRRPTLWGEAIRAFFAMTPAKWWRMSPFLPVPRRSYLNWRLQTAYGSAEVRPQPVDIIRFLEWRKAQR
ncbi:MAG: hypothetical protein OER12_08550 [Acidimicrobiia bacterium]|nr:hypothetical protein [Acidimicrobiia bacterium]